MKTFILVIGLFSGICVQSQTPADVERQLLGPFQRMHYWGSHYSFEDSTINRVDSLEKADTIFQEKFTKALNWCPATLHYPFPMLRDSGVVITTSSKIKQIKYLKDQGMIIIEHKRS